MPGAVEGFKQLSDRFECMVVTARGAPAEEHHPCLVRAVLRLRPAAPYSPRLGRNLRPIQSPQDVGTETAGAFRRRPLHRVLGRRNRRRRVPRRLEAEPGAVSDEHPPNHATFGSPPDSGTTRQSLTPLYSRRESAAHPGSGTPARRGPYLARDGHASRNRELPVLRRRAPGRASRIQQAPCCQGLDSSCLASPVRRDGTRCGRTARLQR